MQMKEEKEEKSKGNFWLTVAGFIVSKRKAIEILFFIAIIYSVLSIGKTQVNQDITKYLPADSETRIGLSTMDEEVVTYGSAKVMISNITYEDASALVEQLEAVKGIREVSFDQTRDHYRGADALFDLTATAGDEDAESIDAMNEVKELLSDYDVYIDTSIGAEEESSESLSADMNLILVLAVLIIIVVLLLSTKSFCEIPVLLITFGVAAILNMGTNYLLGEISSVTNSIAVVLQLALAIDYAIILCDRYMEEHETKDPEEAITVALSKAIPEISSSSLTTISGMAAMMFMQFRLGYDMGIVLIKAILLSLVSVFFLMPGVILIFAKGIDKTMHRSYVPKVGFIGKFASLTKYVIPPIFVVVIIASFFGSSQCQYLYDVDSVESAKKTTAKIASEKITDTFGATNQLVVMVPAGDYEKEALVLNRLSKLDYVTSALGLANQSVNDDYVITDKLNPRQFSELTDLDIEVVRLLYSAYAYGEEQYGPVITGIDDYEVPIIDMFLFLYDQYQQGYVTLSADLDEKLTDLYDILHEAKLQLQGENYSRFVLNIDKPSEGEETYEAMEEIRSIAEKTYGSGTVILVGDSTSCKDLEASFATDNILISVLTAFFVLVILFFTFQSAGLPVLLVLTIQGSIWINFTVPAIQNQGIYFIAYLIVSAIQMGATIDYAIVISSRYMDLKYQMPLKEAISETLNQAFPTIFTSGTILTCAGFLIGQICSEPTIAAIGTALGRGTLISIILVLFVLPQILLLGDYIIEKSALSINLKRDMKNINGRVVVTGRVRGYVEGVIDADVKGSFQGKMQVSVDTILPGRQGQITYTPTEQEKQIAMKEDEAIEEEFVKEADTDEKTSDSGPEEGKKKHKKKAKGGKQHE
jgi:predicted RND superfamily exporter protein